MFKKIPPKYFALLGLVMNILVALHAGSTPENQGRLMAIISMRCLIIGGIIAIIARYIIIRKPIGGKLFAFSFFFISLVMTIFYLIFATVEHKISPSKLSPETSTAFNQFVDHKTIDPTQIKDDGSEISKMQKIAVQYLAEQQKIGDQSLKLIDTSISYSQAQQLADPAKRDEGIKFVQTARMQYKEYSDKIETNLMQLERDIHNLPGDSQDKKDMLKGMETSRELGRKNLETTNQKALDIFDKTENLISYMNTVKDNAIHAKGEVLTFEDKQEMDKYNTLITELKSSVEDFNSDQEAKIKQFRTRNQRLLKP